MIVLGIMSGSSLDGIDFALCDVSQTNLDIIKTKDFPLPKELEHLLRQSKEWTFRRFLEVEKMYTDFLADCAMQFGFQETQLVGIHGHTTYHIPEEGITHQLVNGGRLSARLGKAVVCDFRIGDITLGGVGTPLVPVLEKMLLPGYDYYLNLGGIANLTMANKQIAYDVCPCNQLLNALASKEGHKYDDGGKMAVSGSLNPSVYQALGNFDYYNQSAPKSLDNNWIKENYIDFLIDRQEPTADLLHTVCHWISDVIADQITTNEESKFLVSGGGVHNDFLCSLLKEKLLSKHCQLVIPSMQLVNFKESILMCLMAYLRYENQPNIYSSVTGASIDSVGGAIYQVHGPH